MQKLLKKAIAVTLIAFAGVVMSCVFLIGAKDDRAAVQVKNPSTVPVYTLSEYNGKIALYRKDMSMPVEIYDVLVSSLPETEQQKIRNGISAENDEQALKIIEDYTS